MKTIGVLAIILSVIFLASSIPVEASSPIRIPIRIGNFLLQVRGVDSPHGVKDFGSWPGYNTFVDANCWHIHGELKSISPTTGREIWSIGISVPLYCKNIGKYAKQFTKNAFDVVKGFLGPAGGIFYDILTPWIPTFMIVPSNTCGVSSITNKCNWITV